MADLLPLPPYDPDTRCPKCGYDSVTTKWVDGVGDPCCRLHCFYYSPAIMSHMNGCAGDRNPMTTTPIQCDKWSPKEHREHLIRTCIRCDHKWNEAPIPQETTDPC